VTGRAFNAFTHFIRFRRGKVTQEIYPPPPIYHKWKPKVRYCMYKLISIYVCAVVCTIIMYVHYHVHRNRLSPKCCYIFLNTQGFRLGQTVQPHARRPSIFSCPRLLVLYIPSYRPEVHSTFLVRHLTQRCTVVTRDRETSSCVLLPSFFRTGQFYSDIKPAFNKKKNLFTSKLDLHLRKKLVKCYIWSIAL
jgi:hypothetical protein